MTKYYLYTFLLTIFLASCAPAAPRLTEGAFVFEISESEKSVGTVYGHGDTAIILANMGQGNQHQWDPFVEAFDQDRFTVVTFNYLKSDYQEAQEATSAVYKKLQDSGFKQIVCIGASLGVTACGAVVAEEEIVGLIMIAGPNNGRTPLGDYPKLFMAGEEDPWASAIQEVYETAAEPKTLILLPGISQHGTDMFYYSKSSDEFLQDLLDFVNSLN